MSKKLRGLLSLLNAVSAQQAESKQVLFVKYRISLPLQLTAFRVCIPEGLWGGKKD